MLPSDPRPGAVNERERSEAQQQHAETEKGESFDLTRLGYQIGQQPGPALGVDWREQIGFEQSEAELAIVAQAGTILRVLQPENTGNSCRQHHCNQRRNRAGCCHHRRLCAHQQNAHQIDEPDRADHYKEIGMGQHRDHEKPGPTQCAPRELRRKIQPECGQDLPLAAQRHMEDRRGSNPDQETGREQEQRGNRQALLGMRTETNGDRPREQRLEQKAGKQPPAEILKWVRQPGTEQLEGECK